MYPKGFLFGQILWLSRGHKLVHWLNSRMGNWQSENGEMELKAEM
jgi:hypothetical protein